MAGKCAVIGVEGVKARLERMKSAAFRRAVEEEGARAAADQVALAFRTEGAHYGEKWAPRKESTLRKLTARKRKKNGKPGKARTPKPLLRDTGTLSKSFFAKGSAVATPVEYAVYHEFGTKNMKARPVMPFDKDGKPRSPAVERAVLRAMEAAARLELSK